MVALLLLVACGKGSGASAQPSASSGGYHASGWIAVHPAAARGNLTSCTSCHELSGLRVSGAPSCSTTACHHGTIPGYALAGSHGPRAKMANTSSGGGLASCQICHGQDFLGGASGRACSSCHGVKAPHPPKPWRSGSGPSHGSTDPSNAPVCLQCHAPGSPNNPPGHPASPAPAGTAPGCFNNTLCHGDSAAPHPLGSLWKDPTSSAFHGLEAKKDLAYCQSCHGTPGSTKFAGGVAATACSSCHTAAGAHSKPWHQAPVAAFPGYTPSHRNAGNRSVACALCHDVTRDRTAPLPSAPSCYSSSSGVSCHVNGPGAANHPVPFLETAHTATSTATFSSNCGSCHGLSGSSPTTAPTCATCHQGGSPLALGNCTSCHDKPPAGTAFPNAAGAHGKHETLAGLSGACSTCHLGSEAGTLVHYDHANGRPGSNALRTPPAPVATQATFNAKAGPAAFDPATLTCRNISCHGGQATPAWLAGRLDPTTDSGCRACHTLGTGLGVPESNSPFSGTHALHLGSTVNALCTDCHAMGNGTPGAGNHFKFLSTPQMEGPAADTVAPLGNPANYKASAQTCGTFECHGHLHRDSRWQGGANHGVPYLGAPHTTTTQASFDLDCKACHAVAAGPSPIAAAPSCAACHQGGSPLVLNNCASCHTRPPAGNTFPNIAGSHAKHERLAGITGACSSCHETFDSGTRGHYDHANGIPGKDALRVPPAPMKAMSAFNAKAGTASLDPSTLTCSNISCHGGLLTPSWAGGTLDAGSDAGCRKCHALGSAAGTPEANSPFSGLHGYHLGTAVNAQCTECHAMGNGTTGAANHFKFLSTPQMEGPAADTVAPMGNPAYYQAGPQTCGTFTCHGRLHGGNSWSGGPSHSVPFLSAAHTSTNTPAAFAANCAACHADSGATSPMASAPSCATCHTSGSPLSLPNCTSCHGQPPTGTVFPNAAGTHAVHNSFAGVAGNCAACHTGQGSGTQLHYDHANNRPGMNGQRVAPGEVAIPTTFNAKTGAASFNPGNLTCSNVSCHGGQATPAWTSTASIAANCNACHVRGTTQYNSYNSGEHKKHVVDEGFACNQCHDLTAANTRPGALNHFRALTTSAMEGPASDTIGFAASAATGARTYTVASATNRYCTLTCHGKNHDSGDLW